MERLDLNSLAGQDISSPLLVETYTADADRLLYLQVYMASLAGGGSYKACVTKQLLGAGGVYQSPTNSAALAATVTTVFLPSIAMPVKNTDVVKVYVQGLAGDTSVSVKVEVWDATPLGQADIPTANENADALLKRDWNAVTGEATRSALNALRKLRNKVSFNGVNTLTVTKEDDATPAYTQGVVEDANQDPFKEVG